MTISAQSLSLSRVTTYWFPIICRIGKNTFFVSTQWSKGGVLTVSFFCGLSSHGRRNGRPTGRRTKAVVFTIMDVYVTVTNGGF